MDRRLFDLWCNLYPLMKTGRIPAMGFDEFKHSLVVPKVQLSDKAPEEIEAEMARVVAAYEGR